MNTNEYYAYQTKSRGMFSAADVVATLNDKCRVYDDIVQPWLPSNKNAAIYEVGCGPGVFLLWLKRKGYVNASGSDSSAPQISLAVASGVMASQADSIAVLKEVPPRSLDCIVGLDFYEHLPKEVFLDFLAYSFHALKPGGKLILRGPNGDSPVCGRAIYNDITHQFALTQVAFRANFEMIGFKQHEFKDDTVASIKRHRAYRIWACRLAQHTLRYLLFLATRERIQVLSSSMYICTSKPGEGSGLKDIRI